ncbi:hypothetical protein [Actinomadura formosensis]|uniref:hypothetical protein n=1 Tax=Actinomadura formosensis TaxID=60706 RepID=UPI00083228E6|nr:hypothetical protein [Actinomadura formosensis]
MASLPVSTYCFGYGAERVIGSPMPYTGFHRVTGAGDTVPDAPGAVPGFDAFARYRKLFDGPLIADRGSGGQ